MEAIMIPDMAILPIKQPQDRKSLHGVHHDLRVEGIRRMGDLREVTIAGETDAHRHRRTG